MNDGVLQEAWDAVLCRNWHAAVEAADRLRQEDDYVTSTESQDLQAELAARLPRGLSFRTWSNYSVLAHEGPIDALEFLPDGLEAVTGGADGNVRLWNVASGACVAAWSDHGAPVVAIQVVRGNEVVSLDATGVQIHRTLSSGVVHSRRKTTATALAMMPGGRLALWAGPVGVSVVDFASGRHLRTMETACSVLAISPDGRRAATATPDGTVQLWSVGSGKLITTLTGHRGPVRALAFAADGHLLLTASDDATARCYDVQKFNYAIRTLTGHTKPVTSLAVSADGHAVATASEGEQARLWDLRTGTCVTCLTGGPGFADLVAVSPSGRALLAAGLDGGLHRWTMDWRVQAREPSDWDDGARPCLETFIATHAGGTEYTAADCERLLAALAQRGYGWLNTEGVVEVLHDLVRQRR